MGGEVGLGKFGVFIRANGPYQYLFIANIML